jgi:hypothetical protein
MERTHEEATEAIRAGREGRHSEAALAGEGAHLEVVRRGGTSADGLLPLAEGFFENGAAAFEQKRPTNHSADQERIAYLQKKIQTKDEVLAELMAEHVALKKDIGEL